MGGGSTRHYPEGAISRSYAAQHERQGKLLRQRGGRELFQSAKERDHSPRPFASWQIDQKSEKGVFKRGHQKAGTAGFTPHTLVDAARLAVDEIAGI
jgi:hypothetical protein